MTTDSRPPSEFHEARKCVARNREGRGGSGRAESVARVGPPRRVHAPRTARRRARFEFGRGVEVVDHASLYHVHLALNVSAAGIVDRHIRSQSTRSDRAARNEKTAPKAARASSSGPRSVRSRPKEISPWRALMAQPDGRVEGNDLERLRDDLDRPPATAEGRHRHGCHDADVGGAVGVFEPSADGDTERGHHQPVEQQHEPHLEWAGRRSGRRRACWRSTPTSTKAVIWRLRRSTGRRSCRRRFLPGSRGGDRDAEAGRWRVRRKWWRRRKSEPPA